MRIANCIKECLESVTIHILFDHMICHFYLPMGDFKPMTFVSLDLGVNELPSALPCHLCLFPFFSQVNDRFNIIFHHSNCKSIDVVLRMQTQDGSSRRIHWTNAPKTYTFFLVKNSFHHKLPFKHARRYGRLHSRSRLPGLPATVRQDRNIRVRPHGHRRRLVHLCVRPRLSGSQKRATKVSV